MNEALMSGLPLSLSLSFFKNQKLFSFAVALSLALGIFIQVQVTLFAHGDYLGLRTNLADLLLPLAGMVILGALLARRAAWPVWRLPYLYAWVAALTIMMTGALVHGYYMSGEWSRWAIINKFTGWFVLIAYLGLGGWLTTNYGEKIQKLFLQVFLYFFFGVLILLVAGMIWNDLFPTYSIDWVHYRISGWMGNRNAYAFLMIGCTGLLTVFHMSEKPILPRAFHTVLWAVLPLAFVYNGSRAGWGALLVLLCALLIWRFRVTLKKVILPFLLGMVVVLALYSVNPKLVFRENQGQKLEQVYALLQNPAGPHAELKSRGDTIRVQTIKDALEVWHGNPVFGAGLGSYLVFQKEKYGKLIDIIDCTPLWVLTEMGLLGLFLFGGFYGACLWRLWPSGGHAVTQGSIFRLGVALMLISFAVMALVHELLYTRFLWLFLGMGLARYKEEG